MPREGSLSAAVATDLRTGRAACFRAVSYTHLTLPTKA